MRTIVLLFAVALAARLVASLVASDLEIDSGIVALGIMLLAYAVVSGFLHLQRRRLAKDLAMASPEDRELMRLMHPEFRYAQLPGEDSGTPSARRATWVGLVWVNGPIIPLMAVPLGIRQWLHGPNNDWRTGLLIVLGFALAWGWWSVNVTLWKRWARRRGVDMDELQWRAENSIVWPKGHFFERTELESVIAWLKSPRRG